MGYIINVRYPLFKCGIVKNYQTTPKRGDMQFAAKWKDCKKGVLIKESSVSVNLLRWSNQSGQAKVSHDHAYPTTTLSVPVFHKLGLKKM